MDKKVSVVIPVYGTESYLRTCIDSVLNQSYKNIEAIIVNDCTPDNSQVIIDEYVAKDSRVVCVKNTENKGLFHARLAGADVATGDYIAFLDSDDYLSLDLYRTVVNKFSSDDFDIVMFKFARFNEKSRYYIQNLIDFNLQDMTGDEYRRKFFEQEGLFYNYHTIWNKVYSKKLWDKCRPFYNEIVGHLIMTEDVAYSTVLTANCQKFGFVNEYGLFYLVREDASTSSNDNYPKIKKNATDVTRAFAFAENHIKNNEKTQVYIKNMLGFKERYYRMWYEVADKYLMGANKKECIKIIQDGMGIFEHKYKNPEDFLAIDIETDFDMGYIKLKEEVIKEKTKVVSFDIFDTLVLRPFLDPSDLYYFLDLYYSQITNKNQMIDFSKIRFKAEQFARRESKDEDITIDEIYQLISERFNIEKDIVDKMCAKEKDLEVQFCNRRHSIYEIYQLANYVGKEIIIVSDMYLDVETIKRILSKNGYDKHSKLYVSSDTRKLKYTTNMFRHVLEDIKVPAGSVLHIGDNMEADKIAAEKLGINAYYIPRVVHCLKNEIDNKAHGRIFEGLVSNLGLGVQNFESSSDLYNKCLLQVAANIIFDNPFVSFNSETDFNAKPEIIGTLAFGPHLMTLSKWIVEDAIESGYNKVHFIARDGYMPMKAYNVLRDVYTNAPSANYIYASRKSIIPCLFNNELDKYSLVEMIAVGGQNRRNILDMVSIISRDVYDLKGVNIDATFNNENEVYEFIDLLQNEVICKDKLKEYMDTTKEYFSQIGKNDVTFDLGYSGRIQAVICERIGKSIDTYYLHKKVNSADKLGQINNFKIKTFLNYKPVVSGACREYFYASNEYSCVGFKKVDGQVEVLYDTKGIEKYRHNTELLQEASIAFIKEFVTLFGEYTKSLIHNNVSASQVLENYLSFPKEKDRHFTMMNFSEDFVHGGVLQSNVYTNWNYELQKLSKLSANENTGGVRIGTPTYKLDTKLEKLAYFYATDKKELVRRIKIHLMRRPFLYKLAYKGFRIVKKVRR